MFGLQDISLGQIAVKLGFITELQLDECLNEQLMAEKPIPLGQIMIDKGFITREHLERILQLQEEGLKTLKEPSKRIRDAQLFGRLAVQLGFATQEKIDKAMADFQMLKDDDKTFAELMVEMGYIAQEQTDQILKRQKKIPMFCKDCRTRFTVVTISEKRQVPCPKCGRLLEPIEITGQEPKRKLETQLTKAVESQLSKSKTARVKCIVCDKFFEGDLDIYKRTKCPTCGTIFNV